jgi:hypothetical protein
MTDPIPETRECLGCGEDKSLEKDFNRHPGGKYGRNSRCRICLAEQRKKYPRTPVSSGQRRAAKLRQTYGLTVEDYDALLASQNGKCAICGSEFADKRVGFLHVDHDHETGEVRGLLCSSCNRGLGFFKDDPNLMRRGIEYLERR